MSRKVFKAFPDAPDKLKNQLERQIRRAMKRFGKNKKALNRYIKKIVKKMKKKVRKARIVDTKKKFGSLFPGASKKLTKKFIKINNFILIHSNCSP